MSNKQEIISRKDVVRVIATIISNWYIIVSFPILAFGASYIYTHRLPDIYAAKCQILLKSNETYDYQQQIYRGLGFNSKYASYEETASQMRVIKSSNLIEEVLNSMSLNVAYFIVGRLKVSEVYEHMPFRVVSNEKSSAYSGMQFNLMIIDENKFRLLYEIAGTSRDKTFEFGQLILDDGLYLKIEKEQNLNDLSLPTLKQINYLFKVYKNNNLISKYKSNLDVKNIDYTSIVEVKLQDEIPLRAVQVLDALAKIYVVNTVQNQININDNTLEYIDKQLEEVIDIINDIEIELERYKQQKEILNLSKEQDTYYSRFIEVESSIRTLDFEVSAIEELTDYLLQNEALETLLPPSIFVNDNDPKLQDQVSELYELRSKYNQLMTSGTTDNPKINVIVSQIGSLKEDILRYLDLRKTVILQRKSEMQSEMTKYEQKIKNIPQTQRDILNIERRLIVNEELYSFLLAKRAETVIAKAGLVPETKIIESARSVGVVYPDKLKMNITNALIGLGLAALLILIRVFFFQKIVTVGQLQTSTDVPILGGIPKVTSFSKTYRIRSSSERSDLMQAFRSLRTNIQYFSQPEGCTRVLVTSLMPGEGKTFSSVNLASVLAIAEKRVLIIDFDLHKPRLAKAMEMENNVGVSSYLIGRMEIKDIIQKTDINTLDVITSGPVPPNASELIMQKSVDKIFEYAEKSYDYVILDTPPVSLITDAVILMQKVEMKLFVLNSKSTTKTSLDYIEKLIDKNNFDKCALVLNEERISRLNYYYSRYGYGGYGYGGYGYGGYGYGYGQSKFYGEDPEQ